MARWPCIRSTTVVADIRLAPRPNVRSSLIRLGERSAKWLRRCSVRTAHDDLHERVLHPDHDTIDVGGHGFAGRKKFRDVGHNPRVAFVVDDVASVDPWSPRGIEIRGEAEIRTTGGKEIMPAFDEDMFRIRPRRIVAWGIDGMALEGRDAADV
jgi:PPOX class F420-dependent enzyme/OxyR family protein